MDKLSIFEKNAEGEVKLTSDVGNTFDNVVDELKDISRELLIARKGQEAFVYGEEVEDSEEVDLSEVPEKEVNND